MMNSIEAMLNDFMNEYIEKHQDTTKMLDHFLDTM